MGIQGRKVCLMLFPLFLYAKGNYTYEAATFGGSVTFEGSLLLGFAYNNGILSLLSDQQNNYQLKSR